ncbi:MAG: ribbon-helix-helix protein, CopG family [Bryobacteraceae bacterium]
MTRLLLSIEEQDKTWLEQRAAERGISMAEIVREAVRTVRAKEDASLGKLLKETSGVWNAGDGLKYQRRLRSEWK